MSMPLAAFWSANRQIDRREAQRDQRSLRIAIAAQDGKIANDTYDALRVELESPAVFIKGFDEAQFERLRAKLGKNKDGGS